MILRCTAKVLQLLGVNATALSEASVASPDDDWYANLLWFDRRKCLLLTHAGTLFSVFVADVRKEGLLPVGSFVVAVIEGELRSEGLPLDTFGRLEGSAVHLGKTASRSVLGCMNDMALQCQFFVADKGGLGECDIRALNRHLRRTISSPRGYARPIDLAAELVEPPRN